MTEQNAALVRENEALHAAARTATPAPTPVPAPETSRNSADLESENEELKRKVAAAEQRAMEERRNAAAADQRAASAERENDELKQKLAASEDRVGKAVEIAVVTTIEGLTEKINKELEARGIPLGITVDKETRQIIVGPTVPTTYTGDDQSLGNPEASQSAARPKF